VAKVQQIKG